jgi:alkylation response protein AidB-like acyl-CoA dehydrogenase
MSEQRFAATRLERDLNGPDAAALFSPAPIVALDEREQMPAEQLAWLDRWGLQRWYVPQESGGDLTGFDDLLLLLRSVARRDLTTAIVHSSTILGSVAVWASGNDAQRARHATLVLSGGAVALAYHEKDHGSDLLSNEVVAKRTAGGAYRLTGVKWMINNASRGRALLVHTRTEEDPGPRSHTLFMVDKNLTADHEPIDRLRLHGIRGADLSGIRFSGTEVPETARIGPEGRALEVSLRACEVTRTLIPAVSLGALEAALRSCARHTSARILYGRPALDIADVRSKLAQAYAELLASECIALASARGLHACPEAMRVWSAAVKLVVPRVADRGLATLAEVLGARYYLRQEHEAGIFQKILRDHGAASFHAGRHILLGALGLVARQGLPSRRVDWRSLRPILAVGVPVGSMDYGKLRTAGAFDSPALESLESLSAAIDDCALAPDVAAGLSANLKQMKVASSGLSAAVTTLLKGEASEGTHSTEYLDLADRYGRLHAAALATAFWLCNRDRMDPFFAGAHWLLVAHQGWLPELIDKTSAFIRARVAVAEELRRRLADAPTLSFF